MTTSPPDSRPAAKRPGRLVVALGLVLAVVAVALGSVLDAHASSGPGLQRRDAVAASPVATGPAVAPLQRVLAGQHRARAPNYDQAAVGSRVAPNTARAFPQELAVVRNAQSGVHVYHGVDAGKPVYAGITDDIARRQAQHGGRFVLDQLTPAAGVTRGQARAIEEALIVRNPGFQNLRHEISPSHSWYRDALDWGNDWLTGQGL